MLGTVVWTQWRIGKGLRAKASHSAAALIAVQTIRIVFAIWLLAGFLLTFHRVGRAIDLPMPIRGFLTGGAYLWAFSSTAAYLIYLVLKTLGGAPPHNPARRRAMNVLGGALVASPFAVTGFGVFIQRTDFRVREIDLPIANLPQDLNGLRLLQLTDIHLGPYLSESQLAGIVDESNQLRPDIGLITGDLITMGNDPLDACLAQLARLRAQAGLFGCLGNHEAYAGVERYTTEQGARGGIEFLRQQSRLLRFGSASLNLAGVDYQSIARREAYLRDADRLIAPGALNILLSHNPDVFPVAARQGYDVTIAGHTHGGQVAVEILHQSLNVARFITPYVYGYFRLSSGAANSPKSASLYVSRGIGTIALPVRIGAPPEISLLRLVSV